MQPARRAFSNVLSIVTFYYKCNRALAFFFWEAIKERILKRNPCRLVFSIVEYSLYGEVLL
jgi:hypothetical protein